MGIGSDILTDWHASRAALEWLHELGAFDPVTDAPLDRYALPERDGAARMPVPPRDAGPVRSNPAQVAAEAVPEIRIDPVAEARRLAQQAPNLEALREALVAFEHCDLKRGARSTVFSTGVAGARVMIIGEAPGRDEDLEGLPFAGTGALMFDRMFAAIGMGRDNPDRERALYVTSVIPWRPGSGGEPAPRDLEILLPFLERHVALADPEVLVVMGNGPAQAVLQARSISRIRGTWAQAWGRPVLPMLPPSHLLRDPRAKREAWSDLLALQSRLAGR